jgi:hypothetical protein
MGIQAECETCGYKYTLKVELAGKKVKCKICQAKFRVPPADHDIVTRSPAGNPIVAHAPRKKEFEVAIGDEESIGQVSDHIERHFGTIDMVWHEMVSDLVHVDVHWIKPTAERPHHILVTSGMSQRPMTVPQGAEDYRYAELVICLPSEWQLSMEAFKDESWYWPVRLLKILARFAHEYDTWLCVGHTVPNEDPPRPYAPNTKLCCALLMPAILAPESFRELRINDEKTIRFYSVVPIYREEMKFKLEKGLDPLIDKFDKAKLNELLNVKRVNVCKTGWW